MATTTPSQRPYCDIEYPIADTQPIPPDHPPPTTCKKPQGDGQAMMRESRAEKKPCSDGLALEVNRLLPTECFTTGQKGYGRPRQHLLFQTTSAVYGKHPPPPGLNKKPLGRDCRFTRHLAAAGLYVDSHFTNEKDKEFVYSPPTLYY